MNPLNIFDVVSKVSGVSYHILEQDARYFVPNEDVWLDRIVGFVQKVVLH